MLSMFNMFDNGAQKSIAVIIIIGVIICSNSPLTVIAARSLTIARRTSSNIKTLSDSSSASDSQTLSHLLGIQIASNNNIIAAAVSKVAIHTLRGGAIDNGDPQRRKGRGYYDTDARRDYHDADSRGRGRVDRDRPPQRPSRADLRGQPSDDSPKRDVRPQQKGDNRDRRYNNNRYDDRPNNRKSREDDDFNKSFNDRRDDHQRSNSKIYPSNNINTTDNLPEGKKKKWFSRRKDTADSNDIIIGQTETGNVIFPNNNHQPPPPPPPPPPPNSGMDINPADTERVPIHYMFPTAESAAEERQMSDTKIDDLDDDIINTRPATDSNLDGGISDVPYLDAEEDTSFFDDRDGYDRRRRRRRSEEDDDEEVRGPSISARRDAVTIFMSTKRGAIKVRIGSTIVGIALGAFIGKSLLNDPVMMSMAMSSLLLVTGYLRNDYGELSRAIGLAFVFTLQRVSSVRKDYPTLPHLKAMIGQAQRRPFPPVEDGESPWKYEPIYRNDPDFKMTYTLLAMALVGSFCGGNIPIIPAWMGGIAGAVLFASFTTGANARGDLGRTMGMRVVGLLQLVLSINSELRILSKAATVGGLIFDKFMIMDRKHRIKDKIVSICKWGFDKVSRTAEQVKEEMQDEKPERRRRYDD